MTPPSQPVSVQVQRLAHGADLPLPHYASAGAAGVDLLAAVEAPLVLAPGARALVPTGLALSLPAGYEAQIRPRSGNAAKYGLSIPNSPGTIDSDYRGEVKVLLVNLGQEEVTIARAMRIAQLVVAPVSRIAWQEAASLPESERGANGFGSTGTGGA